MAQQLDRSARRAGREGPRAALVSGRWVGVLLTAVALCLVPVIAIGAATFRPSLVIVGVVLAGIAGVVLVAIAPGAVVPTAWVLIVFVGVVRRIVAGPAGHLENDPLIALPYALLLPFLVVRPWWVSRYRTHLWLSLLFSVVVALSMLVAAVQAVPDLVTIRAFVEEFAAPLCAVALIHPALRRSLGSMMSTVRMTTLISAVYGIAQFAAPAPWDMRWLRNVVLVQGNQTFGEPLPQQFRLFGTLSSPLAYGVVLSVGIVCWALSDTRLWVRVPVILVLTVPLLLTQVRTSVFALAVALPITMLVQYRQRAVLPLLAIGAALAAIPMVLNALDPRIVNRFSPTDLQSDASYTERVRILLSGTGSIFTFGGGPGASSHGSIPTDNGYLAIFVEFGLIGGLVFLALLAAALILAFRFALTATGPARGLPLALVLLYAFSETSAPVIQSQQGLVFWVTLAVLGTGVGGELLGRRRRRTVPSDAEPASPTRSEPAPVPG